MKHVGKLLFITITSLALGFLKSDAQAISLESSTIISTEGNNAIKDSVHLFTIQDIVITGNHRTRNSTILREVSFKKGEKYPLNILVSKFAQAKKQLVNTSLFHYVVVSLQSIQGYDAIVHIDVKERWYIFPVPFIRTVDKSFGEWVKEKNMDLSRVNYGLQLNMNNISGRNDKLYLYLMNGYTKQLAFRYNGLYLDKKLQWSTNMSMALGKNKELRYITVDNKSLAIKNSNQFVHSFFRSSLEVNYRKAIKTRHTFGLAYSYEDVADTVYKLNPFFATQRTIIRYPEVYYRLSHFNTDFNPYPTKGVVAELQLDKKGFNHNMNLWELIAKGSKYWPLSSKYFFNLSAAGGLKLPFRQPYITQQFVGSNDLFMQGYEYYVIDGEAGGYTKATFSRQLINTSIHIASAKLKQLNSVPIRLYAKIYGNAGYIYNKQPGDNVLCNKLLYTGGLGLDLVTFYDFVLKVEWSFNQLGQNGLYLHRSVYF